MGTGPSYLDISEGQAGNSFALTLALWGTARPESIIQACGGCTPHQSEAIKTAVGCHRAWNGTSLGHYSVLRSHENGTLQGLAGGGFP